MWEGNIQVEVLCEFASYGSFYRAADGWTMESDACYLAGEGEMTWSEARGWCKHNYSQADLVSIHSPLENDKVNQMWIW